MNHMSRLAPISSIIAAVVLVFATPSAGAASDGADATATVPFADETTPIRPPAVYPTTVPSPPGATTQFCVGGVGGDCDEWYTNLYGNKVLVTDQENDYVKDKHGISKGMIRWTIENGYYDSNIVTGTATRRAYRTVVRRIDCDPTCHDAGVQVNVISIVEWAGYGDNRGALISMYCSGYSGMCPKWIQAL